MQYEARIVICTNQHSITDGEELQEQFDYNGTVFEKNGAFYIGYVQKDEGSIETQNRLIAYEDKIVRTSKGDSFSRMEFVPGKETKTMYATAYGTFDMTFMTKYYSIKKVDEKLSIELEYILSINGEPSSEMTMSVVATAL